MQITVYNGCNKSCIFKTKFAKFFWGERPGGWLVPALPASFPRSTSLRAQSRFVSVLDAARTV